MIKSSDLPPHLKAQLGFEKKHKYGVSSKAARTADGITFDSKKEMNWYLQLASEKRVGYVSFFLRQVPFHLPGNVRYVLDFLIVYADGHIEYHDVKGFKTAEYRMKKKMVEALYPIKIREV